MIAIDRLVLSIDAMTPERAERLVRMAGRMLAEAPDARTTPRGTPNPVARIDVALPAGAASDAAIAAAMCAAIRARIG